MEREGGQTGKPGRGGLAKLLLAGLGALVFSRIFKSLPGGDGGGDDEYSEGDRKLGRLVLQSWLIVCGISAAFVLYGFLAFFAIGDKGSPDWDYGSLPDVPGQSTYSTYPFGGRAVEPEPQHVDEGPAGTPGGGPKGARATAAAGTGPSAAGKQPEQGSGNR